MYSVHIYTAGTVDNFCENLQAALHRCGPMALSQQYELGLYTFVLFRVYDNIFGTDIEFCMHPRRAGRRFVLDSGGHVESIELKVLLTIFFYGIACLVWDVCTFGHWGCHQWFKSHVPFFKVGHGEKTYNIKEEKQNQLFWSERLACAVTELIVHD